MDVRSINAVVEPYAAQLVYLSVVEDMVLHGGRIVGWIMLIPGPAKELDGTVVGRFPFQRAEYFVPVEAESCGPA